MANIDFRNDLTIISIDRFRKVCRSLKWQFSNRTARILCLAVFIVGFLFSWPSSVISGIYEFIITPQNITGTACAIKNEYKGTLYARIYNGLLWILFMCTISVTVKILKFGTPQTNAIIVLKIEKFDVTSH